MYVQDSQRADFSILDGHFLDLIQERRRIIATEQEIQPRQLETTYCCRVAAKILRLLEGFRDWRLVRGESDWVKASVSWVVERLLYEYPDKMVRRGLALLEKLGIVDRTLSSDAKMPGKGRWKNPCLTWFYRIKIDLNDWVKSTQASRSILPKHYQIPPESAFNQQPVVEEKLISEEGGIEEKVIFVNFPQQEKNDPPVLTSESSEQTDIPAAVEEDFNIDEIANSLTHDQILELEQQRQDELQQIEDLRIDLHPKLLRLILAVPIARLRDAIAAMKQQVDNKRQRGQRLRDSAGFLELAVRNGYQPNKKSEAWGQNGSDRDFIPDQKHITLPHLWKLYSFDRNQFIEAARYYGHNDRLIADFLSQRG